MYLFANLSFDQIEARIGLIVTVGLAAFTIIKWWLDRNAAKKAAEINAIAAKQAAKYHAESIFRQEQLATASKLLDTTARLVEPYKAENWDAAWTEFCALYHGGTHLLDNEKIWNLLDQLDKHLQPYENGAAYIAAYDADGVGNGEDIVHALGLATVAFVRKQFDQPPNAERNKGNAINSL